MWTTISVCMSLRLFHPSAFSAASHNKPFIDCETKTLSSHVVSFSHANSKSKTRIQAQDILMPKSELVCLNRDDGQCLSNEYSFMGYMWIFPEQAEQGTQEVLKRFKKNIWIFPSCNLCVYEGKGEKTAAKNYILWISSRETWTQRLQILQRIKLPDDDFRTDSWKLLPSIWMVWVYCPYFYYLIPYKITSSSLFCVKDLYLGEWQGSQGGQTAERRAGGSFPFLRVFDESFAPSGCHVCPGPHKIG